MAFILWLAYLLEHVTTMETDSKDENQKKATSLLSIDIFKWNYILYILQEKSIHPIRDIHSISRHVYTYASKWSSWIQFTKIVGIDELFKKTPRIRHVPCSCPKSSPVMKQGCFQNVTTVQYWQIIVKLMEKAHHIPPVNALITNIYHSFIKTVKERCKGFGKLQKRKGC